ncbi:MAG TPA: sigma-70 family RNA polymerase sigma factor [Gammaproteobacteria bacterium]|nr:sigma-70 family RNA polymerase sigma factor [Gammaproteobacteria bacterium]
MTAGQERRVSEEIAREEPRLRRFIRRRVGNEADVEDILQDVFSELVEAYRLMKSVEDVGAWLFRVARNRITDLFRKRSTEARAELPEGDGDEDEGLDLEAILASAEAGPETAYTQALLLDELEAALSELSPEQREAFIAHEFEGKSFKELAAETGQSVNTLLSRKHYAVRYLRQRLQVLYEEFKEP